jgi:Protein of unknown function (DUF4242)
MERYLAELYLPRAGADGLPEAARRARAAAAAMTSEGTPIRYLRAIFLGGDEICFHLYEAASPEAVLEATRRAAIPVERVLEAVDVEIDRAI